MGRTHFRTVVGIGDALHMAWQRPVVAQKVTSSRTGGGFLRLPHIVPQMIMGHYVEDLIFIDDLEATGSELARMVADILRRTTDHAAYVRSMQAILEALEAGVML